MVQLSKPPEETVKMGIKDGAVLYWWILFLQMDCSFHFRRACGAHLSRWNHFFQSRARYNIEITPSNAFHLSKGIV